MRRRLATLDWSLAIAVVIEDEPGGTRLGNAVPVLFNLAGAAFDRTDASRSSADRVEELSRRLVTLQGHAAELGESQH